MSQERIIITGITGFTGSHLVEKVLEFWKNPEVYGFKRPSSNLSNLVHLKDHINLLDVDFLDRKALAEAIAQIVPTKVFHLAATNPILYSFKHPVEVMQANTIGTINLLDALKEYAPGTKLHMCSTSEVYGDVPLEQQPITEATRLFPQNPFGISKAACDLFAHCYHKSYHMNIFITTAFTITGPRKPEFLAESSFAKQIAMIEKGQKEPIIRVGNLSSIRTFVDVRDAVTAYCMVMERCPAGEVYVISGDTTMSIREVLNRLLSMSDVKVKIEVDPGLLRPADIAIRKADSSKIRKEFGWQPKIPLDKSLQDLLDYWRARI